LTTKEQIFQEAFNLPWIIQDLNDMDSSSHSLETWMNSGRRKDSISSNKPFNVNTGTREIETNGLEVWNREV